MSEAKEINNSPLMKMVNTLLKKRFPWILKVSLSENKDPYEYTKLMFVNVFMEPFEFADAYGVELKDYVRKWVDDKEVIVGSESVSLNSYSSLCTLVKGECPDEIKELERNIEKEMSLPFRSKTVPEHFFDIMKGRQFATTSFVTVRRTTQTTQP